MDTIQATISHLHRQKKDDDLFIEEITNLAGREGERVYQVLIQSLTSLDLPADLSHEYWRKTLAHRDQMSTLLGRNVNLVTALGDYLFHHDQDEYTPFLIDAKNYEQIIQQSDTRQSIVTMQQPNQILIP